MELKTYLKINPADSVVVCLQPKKKGDIIEAGDERAVTPVNYMPIEILTKENVDFYRRTAI